MKIKLPCAVPTFGVQRHCGDAAAVRGKGKRHDFHLSESLRSIEELSEGSLDLEKGTFGLVRAARIDNDKPIRLVRPGEIDAGTSKPRNLQVLARGLVRSILHRPSPDLNFA